MGRHRFELRYALYRFLSSRLSDRKREALERTSTRREHRERSVKVSLSALRSPRLLFAGSSHNSSAVRHGFAVKRILNRVASLQPVLLHHRAERDADAVAVARAG